MNKYLQSFLKETNLKGEKGIKGESEKGEKGKILHLDAGEICEI